MRCVYPKCENSSRTRGLCHGHYQTMRDRVRKGKATEDDLQRRRLLLPKGQGGSPAPDSMNAFNLGSEVEGRELWWRVSWAVPGDLYTGHSRSVPAPSAALAEVRIRREEKVSKIHSVESIS